MTPHRQEQAADHTAAASSSAAGEIVIPVSIGELIDKITILRIKSQRMADSQQLANVQRELTALQAVSERIRCDATVLTQYTDELTRVNEALWDVEDAIRDCEANSDFGDRFVALARSVYQHNDERARIKKAINIAAGSRYLEEKSYKPSTPRGATENR
jgi:hypothetical protein